MHVDKDMAEISMAKEVWNAKINLCWWHFRQAVQTRLGQGKLATTPYNVQWAHIEFPFIDMAFIPLGCIDAEEYEGGVPDDIENICPTQTHMSGSNTLSITIPAQKAPSTSAPEPTPAHKSHHCNTDKETQGTKDLRITIKVPPLHIAPASSQGPIIPHEPESSDDEDEEGLQNETQRKFCPAIYRQPIVTMLERHYCAHPSIPGSAHPSPEGIKKWAVQKMYGFCVKYDL
ncbi:hypothetical protein B0F90DRAFT_1821561 [Multifurca ochricompacta]|uniref:Uncharacterized protein n=1 Tax=Multifurca ochricompacta TaxID=376703 RepID=A0AAD4LX41_9AGAM|nr:hypothetical protein B0F90DRAFT_1821561 [Multifurca ochricompacta]